MVSSVSVSIVGWLAYARLNVIAHHRRPPPIWTESARAALFAVSSALIGGAQMIVHTKALAEMFDMMAVGQFSLLELLYNWFFWVELSITAVCGIFWAVQMNNSLALYDPLFIIPLLQASYITFGAAASGIYYREFETLAESGLAARHGYAHFTWYLFGGGILLIVGGLLLLAPPSAFNGCCQGIGPPTLPTSTLQRRSSPRIISHEHPIELEEMQLELPELDLSQMTECSPVLGDPLRSDQTGKLRRQRHHRQHSAPLSPEILRRAKSASGMSQQAGFSEMVRGLSRQLNLTSVELVETKRELGRTQERVARLEARMASTEEMTKEMVRESARTSHSDLRIEMSDHI